MVHFVGAGCGAEDLITVRGLKLIEKADVIIYAGSLINKKLLDSAPPSAIRHDSSGLTLEEVLEIIKTSHEKNPEVELVRLHSGDVSIYSSMKEQMDSLSRMGIDWDITPGVTAAFGAAASLSLEYTIPGISQSLIITRMEGRTPVSKKESIESFAAHGSSMAIYLSSGLTEKLQEALLAGGYSQETPAAIVYKASWPEEKRYMCTVGTIHKCAMDNNIGWSAIVLVGDFINAIDYARSCLYDPGFSTGYRNVKV